MNKLLQDTNNIAATQITNILVKEIQKHVLPDNILYLKASKFTSTIFKEIANFSELQLIDDEQMTDSPNIIIGDTFVTMDKIEKKFDYIVGDLPLGLRRLEWIDRSKRIELKIRKNWLIILKSLFLLNENGYGLFLVERFWWSTEWKKFLEELQAKRFFINAIFNAPENLLLPETSLQPNIILISKVEKNKVFIADLTDVNSVDSIISNFFDNTDSTYIETGSFLDKTAFNGFYNYKIKKQIKKLKTQYQQYDEYKIISVSTEINSGEVLNLEDKDNSIYILEQGDSPVISTIKPDNNIDYFRENYFQVVLNESIVNHKYVEIFFSSELGQLILRSLYVEATILKLEKTYLEDCLIPIPPLTEQTNIITANDKLNTLILTINEFKKELSLNPKNINSIHDKIENVLDYLSMLTGADKIRSIIRRGESKTIEFKQTLSLDIKKNTKEAYIEKSVLKTVVAFFNTKGGTLLIGIGDNGDIFGIQEEIMKFHKNNDDKFLLHFKNLIKDKIGEKFYPFIDYNIITIDSKKVLYVECKASTLPCFYEEKEFYIRTNPATDMLEGTKLVEYIKIHFYQ